MEKADSRSVAAENSLNFKWSIVQFMEWRDYFYLDTQISVYLWDSVIDADQHLAKSTEPLNNPEKWIFSFSLQL